MIGWKARPGETPIDDFSCLKKRGVKYWKEVAVLEAKNIRKPLLKYLGKKPNRRIAPFDYSWALRLHKEMYQDVWTWAGEVRVKDLNVGVPWQQVESRLFDLMKNLAHWEQSGMDIHEQAVRLHHQAVFIHPFMGGNGRWARLLESIWLKLHGKEPTAWPE